MSFPDGPNLQHLQALAFEQAATPMLVLNRELLIREINHAALNLFRADLAACIGQPISNFIGPVDRKRFQHMVRQLVKGDRSTNTFPIQMQDCHNRFLDGEMRANRLELPSGDLYIVISIERYEEMDQEIFELRKFFDIALELLAIADFEGRFVKVNRSWEDIVGYTKEELEGKHFLDFVHPDDLQATLDVMKLLEVGDNLPNFVNRYRTRNGSYRYIEWKSVPSGKFIFAAARDITERNQYAAALADANRLLSDVLRSAADVSIIAMDPAGIITIFNRGAERMLGYTVDEVVGTVHYTLIQNGLEKKESEIASVIGLRLPEANPAVDKDSLKDESHFREAVYHRKDGTEVSVSLITSVMRSDDGAVTGYLAIAEDITDRKRVEKQLAEERRRLQSFIRYAPAAVAMFDTEMRYIAYSERWVTAYRLQDRELLGVCHYDVFPDIPDRWREAHQRCLKGIVERCDDDCWISETTGKEVHIQWEIRPWNDDRGHVAGLMMFTQDISPQKELEASLARRNAALDEALRELYRTKSFLEESNSLARVGAWEVDMRKMVVTWSQVTREIHEAPDDYEPSIEKGVEFYKEGEDRAKIKRVIEHAIKHGSSWDLSLTLVTFTGREVAVRTIGQAEMQDGVCIRLYGAFQDITKQVEMENMLREREAELLRANEVAETANKAKSAFLSNMSHEIRTPLNAIIGMAEMLQDVIVNKEARTYVETIRTSSDLLLSLLNDILDFSKIEAGHFELEHTPLNLRRTIEAALDLVTSMASAKGIDLLFWIDEEVPEYIIGDETRLSQILVNLLSNAVKFTEEGEVLLKVKTVTSTDGEMLLHFSVRDTGIGIPESRLDRLFRRFSQVDPSTVRNYGGSGLGLAICARLIELMDGRIWVKSEYGKGSDFQFELPLHEATHLIEPSEPSFVTPSLEGARVLIVDDNETNRWILRNHLTAWGLQPLDLASPTTALELIAKGEPFDAAIIDGRMPEMDGFTLTKEIRKYRSENQLPIIILTSMRSRGVQKEELGISHYLTKPVKTLALFDVLKSSIARKLAKNTPTPQQAITKDLPGVIYPLRVLVAEDNAVNQKVVRLMLLRLGYEADFATNGMQALEMAKRGKYDVILMDIQMPEMDGLETSLRICHMFPPESRPWMIAVTANVTGEDRQDAFNSGMNDYLSKPVRSQDLAKALKNAWLQKKSHDNSPPQ